MLKLLNLCYWLHPEAWNFIFSQLEPFSQLNVKKSTEEKMQQS